MSIRCIFFVRTAPIDLPADSIEAYTDTIANEIGDVVDRYTATGILTIGFQYWHDKIDCHGHPDITEHCTGG